MNNNIIIELCAEDRARLDRLTEALDKVATNPVPIFQITAEPPTAAQEVPKEEPQELAPQTTESATQPEPESVAPIVSEEPTPRITLTDIQSKVMQLATANGGAKKTQVRGIISAYGAKVSDLKEQPDKWTEVWAKLTALEREA
jgi:hypothetical protein